MIGSCNGVFRAVDRRTGAARWTYDTGQDGPPVAFHTDPLVVEDFVITGTDLLHGPARLYAFDLSTGNPRWTFEIDSGTQADVIRAGSNVCGVTSQDQLFCADVRTGKEAWKSEAGQASEDRPPSPALATDGSRIFFGGRDGVVRAFDSGSGRVLWKRELGGRITTSTLYAGGSLYAGSENRRVLRLDPQTGSIASDLPVSDGPTGRMLFAQSALVLLLSDKKLVALDPGLEKVRWTQTSETAWTTSRPFAWKDQILAGDAQGRLFAFRANDGSSLWQTELKGSIRSIGFFENQLYVGTIQGTVYSITP